MMKGAISSEEEEVQPSQQELKEFSHKLKVSVLTCD
jgi:hypothetical protein